MIYWYENGVQKSSKDDVYPPGEYGYTDDGFTRLTFEAVKWIPPEPKEKTVYEQHARGAYGIMDTMNGIKSMADGKMYDSKSKYLAALKATDSHVIEAGENNPASQAKLRGDFGCRKDLKQAIQKHLH